MRRTRDQESRRTLFETDGALGVARGPTRLVCRVHQKNGRVCQKFRVWAGIMGKKETPHGPTPSSTASTSAASPCASRKPGGAGVTAGAASARPRFPQVPPKGPRYVSLLGGTPQRPLGPPCGKPGRPHPTTTLTGNAASRDALSRPAGNAPIRQAEISSEQVAGNVGIRRDGMLGEQTGRLATMPPGIGDGRKCGNSSEVLHIWWLFITETLNY